MVGRNSIVNKDTIKVGINKDAIKIGFIGVGYMGYGMAHNLLKNNYSVSVIAHKNRKTIDKLVEEGAIECKSMKELGEINNVIVMCVTNTPIATEIANEIVSHLNEDDLVIDITTHQVNGSIKIENIFNGPILIEEQNQEVNFKCDLYFFNEHKIKTFFNIYLTFFLFKYLMINI